MSYEIRTDGKQNGRNEVCRVNTKQKSTTTICTNEWKIYPLSAQTVTGILIKTSRAIEINRNGATKTENGRVGQVEATDKKDEKVKYLGQGMARLFRR